MHVMYEFTPGGMEFGVIKLVNALQPRGIDSSVCSTRTGANLHSFVAPGIPVFELERRDGNDPRLIARLYSLFRRVRPDIVHTHAWGTLIEGLVAARLARVPAVVHGEHGTLQVRRHQCWMQRHAWGAVDQVLSVSTRLSERMATTTGYPLTNIETIRNGVELQRFRRIDRAEARAALGLPLDDIVIGSVGRLVRVKNQEVLIDAVRTLRAEGLPVSLAIAGDGPLRQELLDRAAAAGVAGSLHLLGHRADVEVVLSAFDIFALPSLSEGLSNTMLEAMAASLPVVATRVGGADEVIEDGISGVLVPVQAQTELVRALGALASDPMQRASIGTAARRRIESYFSVEGMVAAYERVYRRLASPSRS